MRVRQVPRAERADLVVAGCAILEAILGFALLLLFAYAISWVMALIALLGAVFLSLAGVLTSIWAEKFDHAAAVTNFVIAPLTLLSGTFYSVERLSPTFQAISHANPFFYIISGFRYGFIGIADSPVVFGAGALERAGSGQPVGPALALLCAYVLFAAVVAPFAGAAAVRNAQG